MTEGRHADPDRAAFWRSLGTAVAKAALAVAVVGGLTAAAVVWTSRGEPATVASSTPTTAAPEVAAASPVSTPTPAPDPTRASAPEPVPTATATPQDVEPPGRAPEEVTVQVLDGGAGQGQVEDVVTTVEDLGYQIVAVNVARCCYEQTTVFYTAGEQDEAEGLRARDRRFAVVDANPNLSEEVDIHVVVGEDWSGG